MSGIFAGIFGLASSAGHLLGIRHLRLVSGISGVFIFARKIVYLRLLTPGAPPVLDASEK